MNEKNTSVARSAYLYWKGLVRGVGKRSCKRTLRILSSGSFEAPVCRRKVCCLHCQFCFVGRVNYRAFVDPKSC